MACWTSSYTLPIPLTEWNYSVDTLLINNNLWCFYETNNEDLGIKEMKICVFDILTRQSHSVDCNLPADFPEGICHYTPQNEMVYVWVEDDMNMIYKLDTNVMKWEFVMTVNSTNLEHDPKIIGDIMYVLNTDEMDRQVLLSIDLLRKKIVRRDVLNVHCAEMSDLAVHNEQLYFIERTDRVRVVSIIKNGLLETIHAEIYLKCDEECLESRVSHQHTIIQKKKLNYFHINRFNFAKNEWEVEEIKECWDVSDFALRSIAEKDNTYYTVIEGSYTKERKLELRLFEKLPKLSTLCGLRILDEALPQNADLTEIEKVKTMLPTELRIEMDDLVKWRWQQIVFPDLYS